MIHFLNKLLILSPRYSQVEAAVSFRFNIYTMNRSSALNVYVQESTHTQTPAELTHTCTHARRTHMSRLDYCTQVPNIAREKGIE